MLRKIRITFATIFFTSITLLFLDFSGMLHVWLGWMAKIQLVPAVLALNFGVCGTLVLLTLLFGRIYCSLLCPLGVFQDVVARFGRWGKKLPYSYTPAKPWLRNGVLALYVIAFFLGLSAIVSILEPYSAFGRVANNLVHPLWLWGNNVLATLSERAGNYAFYSADVWLKSVPTFVIALLTLVIVVILAWKNGRIYCNSICPVGTLLGFISRFSLYKITIDTQKCTRCGLCARKCKSICINDKEHKIDYSRCVGCMNCIEVCTQGAIDYTASLSKHSQEALSPQKGNKPKKSNKGRKEFLATSMFLAASVIKAQVIPKATDIKPDGGLANILGKQSPNRLTPLVPAGSESLKNMNQHCTACQLCVTVCPNGVLAPSSSLSHFMQPIISYHRGYCRPECVKCSEVCPSGAIRRISKEEKSSIKIGHAVWVRERCIPLTDQQECNNCEHHCPVKAISMVPSVPSDEKSLKIPAINEELCIGCGACEYLCPSRPLSAIYVEGDHQHRFI